MRGIYTSEFWAGALAVALMVLVMMEAGRDAAETGLDGIAIMVSVYIAGRCLIKAVEVLRGGRPRVATAAEQDKQEGYSWRA